MHEYHALPATSYYEPCHRHAWQGFMGFRLLVTVVEEAS
jgi:hypothetical protein